MGLGLGGWDCGRSALAQAKLNVHQLASNQIVPIPVSVTQTIIVNIHKPALSSGVGISRLLISSQR